MTTSDRDRDAPDAVTDPRVARSRARVLDTAADLVREGGLASVTIEALVERSGVARSTIYRHWATRRDVVGAALEHMLPAAPDADVAWSGMPLADRLTAALSPFVGPAGTGETVGLVPLLLVETGRDPDLAGFRDRLLERITAPLRAAVTPAVEAGELRSDVTPQDAVTWLLGPVVVRRFTSPSGVDERFVDRTVAAFLRAHAAAPAIAPAPARLPA